MSRIERSQLSKVGVLVYTVALLDAAEVLGCSKTERMALSVLDRGIHEFDLNLPHLD